MLVIPALCNPNVNAAKDIEGLLNIKSIKIIMGGGINRRKNDIKLIIEANKKGLLGFPGV